MVRREADGNTIYYIDGDGVKQQFNMQEWQYSVVLATQDAQISAKAQNNIKKANYLQALANSQISINAGRPAPTPDKPLMIVVSDPVMDEYGNVTQGNEQEIAWIPPLPDLKMLVVAPKMA